MLRNVLTAVLFVAVCQSAGLIGALSSATGESEWYRAIEKPPFNPPSWLFAPVWVTLYTLMGIAAWLVWRHGTALPPVRLALALFAVQLLLNAAWTPIFFGAHRIGIALAVIVLLLIAVALTTWRFSALSPTAGRLMIPYLLWVAFATVLNASLWWLNRG